MRDESGSNHGCRSAAAVAWLTRVAAVTLCLLVHGCDTVSGGAVELSWKLRPASSSLSDKFVDCDSAQQGTRPVTKIRLHWLVDSPGATEGSQAWSCDDNHGVTGFDLDEGSAQLWLTPECEPEGVNVPDPASPDTFIAPAIVQRQVTRGETVSLSAVEIVVSVSYCRDPQLADSDPQNLGLSPCICCRAGERCHD
jgi:hypothetical protein